MATPISSEAKKCQSRKVLVGDLRRDTRRPATSAIAGSRQTACRAPCRKKTSRAEVAVGSFTELQVERSQILSLGECTSTSTISIGRLTTFARLRLLCCTCFLVLLPQCIVAVL